MKYSIHVAVYSSSSLEHFNVLECHLYHIDSDDMNEFLSVAFERYPNSRLTFQTDTVVCSVRVVDGDVSDLFSDYDNYRSFVAQFD